jgi:hypothetical protein
MKIRKISVKTAGYVVSTSGHSDEQKDAAIHWHFPKGGAAALLENVN